MNRALFQNPACCQYRVSSREAPLRLHKPARRFLSHIQTMADADTWVVVPCCQLLHACEDRGLPTDDGRCKPFKNGGIQDTHRPQGPCHLPARDIEHLADFHSLASRPFSRLRSHACSCIGTKRTPHEANRPVRLPDSAAERRHAPFSSSSAANSFSRASRIAGTLPSVLPAMPKHFGSKP